MENLLKEKEKQLVAEKQSSHHELVDEKKQELTSRMMNGQEVAKQFQRFIAIQKALCLLLSIQILLTVMYYEIDYLGDSNNSNIILYCLNLSTIPCIVLNIMSFQSYNDLKSSQMKQFDMLNAENLILSCFLMLLQPIRFLQDVYINNYDLKTKMDIDFKLNYLLVICSLIKVCQIVACVLNMLKFKNPRASRVCKIYGVSSSNLFTIKCCFKQYPITFIAYTFFVSIMIFSYAYRVSERNLTENGKEFQYYTNSLWLVVVTVSSIGFGDFSPKTIVGRSVGVIYTISGVLTVSIMVVVVINTFELEEKQSKSLRMLKKLELKKQIKTIAGNYIRIALWRVWKNYLNRKKDRFCYIQQQSKDEKLLRSLLKQKIRQSKFIFLNGTNLGEQMNIRFEKIQYSIQSLQENNEQLINYLSNKYFINLDEIKEQPKSRYSFRHSMSCQSK